METKKYIYTLRYKYRTSAQGDFHSIVNVMAENLTIAIKSAWLMVTPAVDGSVPENIADFFDLIAVSEVEVTKYINFK